MLYRLLVNKYYLDDIYLTLFAGGSRALGIVLTVPVAAGFGNYLTHFLREQASQLLFAGLEDLAHVGEDAVRLRRNGLIVRDKDDRFARLAPYILELVVQAVARLGIQRGEWFIEQKNRLHPSIPLLAMTSDLSPTVARKLRSLGVLRCFEKPFDYEEVTRLIMENLAASPVLIPGRESAVRHAPVIA